MYFLKIAIHIILPVHSISRMLQNTPACLLFSTGARIHPHALPPLPVTWPHQITPLSRNQTPSSTGEFWNYSCSASRIWTQPPWERVVRTRSTPYSGLMPNRKITTQFDLPYALSTELEVETSKAGRYLGR